jgi:hypothetical protein
MNYRRGFSQCYTAKNTKNPSVYHDLLLIDVATLFVYQFWSGNQAGLRTKRLRKRSRAVPLVRGPTDPCDQATRAPPAANGRGRGGPGRGEPGRPRRQRWRQFARACRFARRFWTAARARAHADGERGLAADAGASVSRAAAGANRACSGRWRASGGRRRRRPSRRSRGVPGAGEGGRQMLAGPAQHRAPQSRASRFRRPNAIRTGSETRTRHGRGQLQDLPRG